MSELFKSILELTKSLTLTNVLMLGLLILFSFPAYIGYRVINDEKLMIQVASSFEEMRYGIGDCLVYRAQERGEPADYIVRYSFRLDHYGAWYAAIRSQTEPTKAEAKVRCDVLIKTVNKARKAMGGGIQPGDIEHD